MDKLKKHQKTIMVSILLIVGVFTVLFGKKLAVQVGVTCLFWGMAVLIIAWIIKRRNDDEIEQFDNDVTQILTDIATYGEDSEYYGTIDIATANKVRAKIIKKSKKQVISCAVLGFILIMIFPLCMI